MKKNLILDQGTDFKNFINLFDENGDSLDVTHFAAVASFSRHLNANVAYTFGTTLTTRPPHAKLPC